MSSVPKLAVPGAGLPRVELWIARLIFHFGAWRTSRSEASALFAAERDAVLKLAQSCDAETGARRVLIRRLPGLEDSSRYWSVFMTLDHLRIVNESVTGVISELLAERMPPGAASTAAVKPAEGVGPEIVEAFAESCRRLETVVTGAPTLATKTRYAHPWFGPLSAAQWHFMAAFHLRLHRKQIEQVLAEARPKGH